MAEAAATCTGRFMLAAFNLHGPATASPPTPPLLALLHPRLTLLLAVDDKHEHEGNDAVCRRREQGCILTDERSAWSQPAHSQTKARRTAMPMSSE